MSEWITDRLPAEEDADNLGNVYNELGLYTHWTDISYGRAWMPITPPDPYVKPKRYSVAERYSESYAVFKAGLLGQLQVASDIPTREAAERIAAIYEEVMP